MRLVASETNRNWLEQEVKLKYLDEELVGTSEYWSICDHGDDMVKAVLSHNFCELCMKGV